MRNVYSSSSSILGGVVLSLSLIFSIENRCNAFFVSQSKQHGYIRRIVFRDDGDDDMLTTRWSRSSFQQIPTLQQPKRSFLTIKLKKKGEDEEEEDENKQTGSRKGYQNPYADPNYPDLEFIDYSDPNYVVDQGIVGDEFFPTPSVAATAAAAAAAKSRQEEEEVVEEKEVDYDNYDDDDDDENKYGKDYTEVMIEAMREERRRRNDEYQFETYYSKVLKEGQEYRGEWTTYHTDTFLETAPCSSQSPNELEELFPRLVPSPTTLQVISKGYKIQVDDPKDVQHRVDAERICHLERIVAVADDTNNINKEEEILRNQYWPSQLSARDFRGDMGIMCVGNAYTICTSKPMPSSTTTIQKEESKNTIPSSPPHRDSLEYMGPFSEHWAELGLSEDRLRFRIKLHYSTLDQNGVETTTSSSSSTSSSPPPLYLKSMTVCREMLDMWPSDAAGSFPVAWDALFGTAGAPGGLFDPPPVGSADQARHYRLLELPGHATVLIPFQLDQLEKRGTTTTTFSGGNGGGWVTSLDWTPHMMRYQVDRKVKSGSHLSGLRTLELSEIQSENAERYRPRDGGQDMRQ